MFPILIGSIILSFLHAFMPNHWLPILAIGKKENWNLSEITRATFFAGLAHVVSTVIIGIMFAVIGSGFSEFLEPIIKYFGPLLLFGLGIFYIYQHSHHHHFKMHGHPENSSKKRIIFSLSIAMFMSPCFEIATYFFMAGIFNIWLVAILTIVFAVITIGGMVLWVRTAFKGLLKMNWHSLEHNAGIITGITLILTGVFSYIFS